MNGWCSGNKGTCFNALWSEFDQLERGVYPTYWKQMWVGCWSKQQNMGQQSFQQSLVEDQYFLMDLVACFVGHLGCVQQCFQFTFTYKHINKYAGQYIKYSQ